MKKFALRALFAASFSIIFAIHADVRAQTGNSVGGVIFDHHRKPVRGIEIELLDSLGRLVAIGKTKSNGSFVFRRIRRGIYFLKPKTRRTNFAERAVRVDLGGFRRSSGAVEKIYIYLELDPKKVRENSSLSARGSGSTVIFAQNVPKEARRSFESALKNLRKKKIGKARENLLKAILIFPDYFNALETLGDIYLKENKYPEAENVFAKASAVNPKSFRCLFNLATAQNKLNKKPLAVENLKKANRLDAYSINANLLLGIIQRDLRRFSEAEKSLLRAKDISRNKVPDVHWTLALLYFHNLEMYDKAARELELYLEALPENEKKQDKKTIARIEKLIEQCRDMDKSVPKN